MPKNSPEYLRAQAAADRADDAAETAKRAYEADRYDVATISAAADAEWFARQAEASR